MLYVFVVVRWHVHSFCSILGVTRERVREREDKKHKHFPDDHRLQFAIMMAMFSTVSDAGSFVDSCSGTFAQML